MVDPPKATAWGKSPAKRTHAGRRDEGVDLGEGRTAGNLTAGHVRVPAEQEGRGPEEGLREMIHDGGLVGGRVDHLDVVGGIMVEPADRIWPPKAKRLPARGRRRIADRDGEGGHVGKWVPSEVVRTAGR